MTGSPNTPQTPDNASFEAVYQRLRKVARRERRRPGGNPTLNTTALVHEVYLDICAASATSPPPRDFYAYAARAMRNLLFNRARRAARIKHGGGLRRIELDLDSDPSSGLHVDATQALELDEALRRLAENDPRAAEVVELHYFAGLELGQIAELLGVSERTVNRDWRAARAWLQRALSP